MDILYYSNYCKHSKQVLNVLSRCKNLKETISFICIDNREIDNKTNQIFILLENGKKVIKPPSLHSVPALLLVKEKYNILYGDEIVNKLRPAIISDSEKAQNYNGEPMSYEFSSNAGVMSEKYTFCDLSSEELSAKGVGGRRNMHNYVSANINHIPINTPEDKYKPDKLGNNVTIDTLQQQRMNEIENKQKPPVLEI